MPVIHDTLAFLALAVFGLAFLDVLLFFGVVARALFWSPKPAVRSPSQITASYFDESTKVWLSRTRKVFWACWLTMIVIVVLLFLNEGLRHLITPADRGLNERSALDARTALCLHIEVHWPVASESER